MQKRIKLENELREKHTIYPALWKNILLSVNQSSPILPLNQFGYILLVEGSLYLFIGPKCTKKCLAIKPMIKIKPYLDKAEGQTLNCRQLNVLELAMIDWITDYLEKLIDYANRSIFLTIIDLHLLGKLVLSKHSIEYLNHQHNWKYQFVVDRVELPRLLHIQEEKVDNQQMGRKFSLSIQKHKHSQSKKKDDHSRILKRSFSTTKVQQNERRRVATQIVESFFPKQQKLKLTGSAEKQKIQSKKHSKTQGSQVQQKRGLHNKSKSRAQSQSNLERSTSKRKLKQTLPQLRNEKQKQRGRLMINKQEKMMINKQGKMMINKQGIFVPRERARENTLCLNEMKQLKSKNVLDFIIRCSSCLTPFVESYQLSQDELNGYYREIVQIYQTKKDQVAERKKNMALFRKELRRQKIFPNHRKLKSPSGLQMLSANQQQIFKYYYNLVEVHRVSLKDLTKQYIIDYDSHDSFIRKFIGSLSASMQKYKFSESIRIQVGILLHRFYEELNFVEETILDKICSQNTHIIVINVKSQQPFESITSQFVQNFCMIFKFLKQEISKHFPKWLHLESHETNLLQRCKKKLSDLLSSAKKVYEQNLSILKTKSIKQLLQGSVKREKESMTLILQLEDLKRKMDNEVEFKSQISHRGVILNMVSIKSKLIKQIETKMSELLNHFTSVLQRNQSELNVRLRTIIIINIDFLSDLKCKEYKQAIDNNYHSIISSLILLINHFFSFMKPSTINAYLNHALRLKKQIQEHFDSFNLKLNQYRKNSDMTIKMLESQNKTNKKIYQELNQKLKMLLQSLISEKSLIEKKLAILQLDVQFEEYNKANSKLITSMKQNEMIYWEDDTFFITQMGILKHALAFLESIHYKILFSLPIADLYIEKFYHSFEEFTKFMAMLSENKVEKLFKTAYSLFQSQLILAEVFLYKEYREVDMLKFKELNIDFESEKNNKLFAIIKRYYNMEERKLQKLIEIYQQSRVNEYNIRYEFDPNQICIVKEKGLFDIHYISNLNDITQTIRQKNKIKFTYLTDQLNEVSALYQEVILFNKMIGLISQFNLNQQTKIQITSQINHSYDKLLSIQVQTKDIDSLKFRLLDYKRKYMEVLFIQKIAIFSRYCLCSLSEIIDLNCWESQAQIARNTKILFEEIDSVECSESEIKSVTIGRDIVNFEKEINLEPNEGDKTKVIFMRLDNFFRNSLNHSQFASVQIKMVTWFVYFTQQVELSLMTDQPLSKLKESLQQIITEIASQIRYDIKLHHKTYEIAQLKFFINHLNKIKNATSATDFQWFSTLKYRDKLKVIKIQQNDKVYEYAFQPKQPLNVDPSFQLSMNICYGFKESSTLYQTTAYILGQPFKVIRSLSQYGFQENYTLLVNVIKKYGYFIKIVVDEVNFRSVNFCHKRILDLSLKREKIMQLQTLKLPIFFEYSSQDHFPACFPERIKKYTTPDLTINMPLVILLKLNRYQQILSRSNVSMDILCKGLSYFNQQKHLNLRNIDQFIDKFCKFLETNDSSQKVLKFCYNYFFINHHVQIQQTSLILQNLVNIENEKKIEEVVKEVESMFTEFKNSEKENLLIYGLLSMKTHSISRLNLQKYGSKEKGSSAIYYVEGTNELKVIKKEMVVGGQSVRFVIEDRYIWSIDPTQVNSSLLYYIAELNTTSIEFIFKQHLTKMRIEGNLAAIWEILLAFHSTYCAVGDPISFLGMVELITKSFRKHISDQLSQVEQSQKQLYQISLNEEMTKVFTVIIHEIYYYLIGPSNRKKFTDKLKQSSLRQDYKNEDFSALTCKGLFCQKILNLIKRQKNNYQKIGTCLKQVHIAKKYLNFQETVIVEYNSHFALMLMKKYVCDGNFRGVNIALHQKYFHLFREPKYKQILYIIEDIHLGQKSLITSLKVFQEQGSLLSNRFLLTTKSSIHQKYLKSSLTLKLTDVDMEEIFKYQTKEGIIDQIQQKSRLLWQDGYFTSSEQFSTLLLETTLKLPSQYYKKYYSRQLINCKFSLEGSSLDIIKASQAYLLSHLDFNSQKCYLFDQKGSGYEFSEVQVNRKVERTLEQASYLEKAIAKEYYKDILPYCLGDRIHIILEETYLLPMLVAAIQERKIFRLRQLTFVSELVQLVREMYKTDAEFIVVIEEPLSSNKNWLQFFNLYLKELDLINYYDQFREYYDSLVVKEEYIYRKRDERIQIKDKLLGLLYGRMKMVISVAHVNAGCYKMEEYYSSKVTFLNCLLSSERKSGIMSSMMQKIANQQKEAVRKIAMKFSDLVIDLVEADLIRPNRVQHFIFDLVEQAAISLQEQEKRVENLGFKKKLLLGLEAIKRGLEEEVDKEEQKVAEWKAVLEETMSKVATYQRIQNEGEVQGQYFQHLLTLRDNFFNLQQKNEIFIANEKQRQFYQLLKDNIFKDTLTIVNQYILLQLTVQQFEHLITNQQAHSFAVKVAKQYSVEQVEQFILLRYFKYVLSLVSGYQKINYNRLLLQKEINQANYFYLLDVTIELKAKCQAIKSNEQLVRDKLKIIDFFISAFISIEQINADPIAMNSYYIYSGVRKVVRNHAIETHTYPLKQIISKYDVSLEIKSEFDQYLLNQEETSFEEFNHHLLKQSQSITKQSQSIILYDPYWTIQTFCAHLNIQIIYIRSESDLQRVSDYQAQVTVFCIRLTSIKCYLDKKKLISTCLQIISQKHDTKKNVTEKLVISVNDKAIITHMDEKSSMINLDYTLIKFYDFVNKLYRKKDAVWISLREHYIESKLKIKREIQLIRNLDAEETCLYILKLEPLINDYLQMQGEIKAISRSLFQKEEKRKSIEHLFLMVKKFEQTAEIPFNFSIRKLSKMDIEKIIERVEYDGPQTEKELEQFFKIMIFHLHETQVEEEIEQCVQQSRYVAVVYDQFSLHKIKDIFKIEDTGRYSIRVLIDINDQQLQEFLYQSSNSGGGNSDSKKDVILIFFRPQEIHKIATIISKCSVICI